MNHLHLTDSEDGRVVLVGGQDLHVDRGVGGPRLDSQVQEDGCGRSHGDVLTAMLVDHGEGGCVRHLESKRWVV